MQKIITSITILSFILQVLLSPVAMADERVTQITEGEPAPFTGTLFNTEAAARLLIDLETQQRACELRIDQRLEEQSARFELERANASAALVACQTRHTQILEVKDGHIEFLNEQLTRKTHLSPTVALLIGIGSGVAITMASAYALNQVGGN